MNKVPITVLIAAKNEEKNMDDCLKSILWADQVFVLDSQSTDRTIEISESYGAKVAQFFYEGGWPKKRNWGLETLPIRNEWVLLLDADERITPELKKDLEWAIQQPDYNGFYLKWQFIFLGKWMKHSWSHGWMMRFFRHGKGAYEDLGMRGEGGWDAEVHENVVVEGKCGKLNGLLEHNSHEDLFFWIRKQNEFSTWNAKRRLQQMNEKSPGFSALFSSDPGLKRRYLKSVFLKLPLKHLFMFFYLYIIKKGFLDGNAGYYFCWLRSMHELNIEAKVFELSQKEK